MTVKKSNSVPPWPYHIAERRLSSLVDELADLPWWALCRRRNLMERIKFMEKVVRFYGSQK